MEKPTQSFSTSVSHFSRPPASRLIAADGQRSVDLLTKKLGFPLLPADTTFKRPGVRFESYPGMGHSSSDREIRDLKAWLEECLKV
jgi:hypothetical protein